MTRLLSRLDALPLSALDRAMPAVALALTLLLVGRML